MGIPTVLSTMTVRDLANTQLLLRMDRFNTRERVAEQDRITGTSQQEINGAQRQIDRWNALRDDLDEAKNYLRSLVSAVEAIRSAVQGMTTTAYSARNRDDRSGDTYKFAFDAGLRSINVQAEDNGLRPNLLGSATVSDHSYETDLSGATVSLEAYFLGSDYYILDSDGRKWVREPENQLVLQRRDADTGVATGEQASLSTGIRLDSFDPDSGAVTFTIRNTGTGEWDQAFSGTVHRSGLRILDSWLYDGLATDTGRTNALDDLHAAKSVVDVQLAKYDGALAVAEFHDGRAKASANGLDAKVDSLTTRLLLDLQEADNARQFVNGLNRTQVEASTTVRREYLKMFGVDEFTRNLVDALA
jgi:hypothetical protein